MKLEWEQAEGVWVTLPATVAQTWVGELWPPHCIEFMSLLCFAIFRFGYIGSSNFTPIAKIGLVGHPLLWWLVSLNLLNKNPMQYTLCQAPMSFMLSQMKLWQLIVASILNTIYTFLHTCCSTHLAESLFIKYTTSSSPCIWSMSQSFSTTSTKCQNALCGPRVLSRLVT